MAISRQRPLKVQIGHSISLLPPGLDGNGIQVRAAGAMGACGLAVRHTAVNAKPATAGVCYW
jgi:hypothetical protein